MLFGHRGQTMSEVVRVVIAQPSHYITLGLTYGYRRGEPAIYGVVGGRFVAPSCWSRLTVVRGWCLMMSLRFSNAYSVLLNRASCFHDNEERFQISGVVLSSLAPPGFASLGLALAGLGPLAPAWFGPACRGLVWYWLGRAWQVGYARARAIDWIEPVGHDEVG